MRLVRISRLKQQHPEFPFSTSCVYRWSSTGKFPELFVKFREAQSVFLDLDAFEAMMEKRRGKLKLVAKKA